MLESQPQTHNYDFTGSTIVNKKNRMNALSHINEISLPYANEKWEKSVVYLH